MARLGASGDQWAVPRAQSRRTEPYWEPGEVEEEGVARGGVVALLVRLVGQAGDQGQAQQIIMDHGNTMVGTQRRKEKEEEEWVKTHL